MRELQVQDHPDDSDKIIVSSDGQAFVQPKSMPVGELNVDSEEVSTVASEVGDGGSAALEEYRLSDSGVQVEDYPGDSDKIIVSSHGQSFIQPRG